MPRVKKSAGDMPEVMYANDVFGEEGPKLADLLRRVTGSDRPRILLVAECNLVQYTEGLGKKIGAWVLSNGIDLAASPIVVIGSERAKSDEQFTMKIVRTALSAGLGCNDCIVALGGGCAIDIAGWSAAQILGGIKQVRIPTSPIGMLDAAFSTRAMVNISGVKDAIVVPSACEAVVIDMNFVSSLLDGVWQAGLAEALRQALALDAKLFAKLLKRADGFKTRDVAVLEETVKDIIELRQSKGATEFAIWSTIWFESMSNFKLPHGYAITLGLTLDCAYAVKKGRVEQSVLDELTQVLVNCGAMDGADRSRYFLEQVDRVLQGVTVWFKRKGVVALPALEKVGKCVPEEKPDLEAMKAAVIMLQYKES